MSATWMMSSKSRFSDVDVALGQGLVGAPELLVALRVVGGVELHDQRVDAGDALLGQVVHEPAQDALAEHDVGLVEQVQDGAPLRRPRPGRALDAGLPEAACERCRSPRRVARKLDELALLQEEGVPRRTWGAAPGSTPRPSPWVPRVPGCRRSSIQGVSSKPLAAKDSSPSVILARQISGYCQPLGRTSSELLAALRQGQGGLPAGRRRGRRGTPGLGLCPRAVPGDVLPELCRCGMGPRQSGAWASEPGLSVPPGKGSAEKSGPRSPAGRPVGIGFGSRFRFRNPNSEIVYTQPRRWQASATRWMAIM